eukprot:scaffold938_cov334-Pavlova_lutheri.AAC.13
MNVDYLHGGLANVSCCVAISACCSLVFSRKGTCLPLLVPLFNPFRWTERSVRLCVKRTVCAILSLLLHALVKLVVARVAMPGLEPQGSQFLPLVLSEASAYTDETALRRPRSSGGVFFGVPPLRALLHAHRFRRSPRPRTLIFLFPCLSHPTSLSYPRIRCRVTRTSSSTSWSGFFSSAAADSASQSDICAPIATILTRVRSPRNPLVLLFPSHPSSSRRSMRSSPYIIPHDPRGLSIHRVFDGHYGLSGILPYTIHAVSRSIEFSTVHAVFLSRHVTRSLRSRDGPRDRVGCQAFSDTKTNVIDRTRKHAGHVRSREAPHVKRTRGPPYHT